MTTNNTAPRSTRLLLAATLTLTALVTPALMPAAAETFDHSDWDAVLAAVVDERGFVDYEALGTDRAQFDRYIKSVQSQTPDSHPALFPTEDDELAFWMNAYNAQVFLGVLDWGTDIDSVWSGLISGRNFFVKRKITLGGSKTSLKKFEDDIIRERYQDPRIHAAINCASISCPRLPQEAFLGAKLDEQLDAAMREFVSDEKHFSADPEAKAVSVSKIFDWFEKDFTRYDQRNGGKGSVLGYINRYRAGDAQIPTDYDVDFLSYDKGLNRQ